MKRITLSAFMLFLASGNYACPICGCGGSNVYMGLFPDFRRGFMGIRYNYAHYHTTLSSDPSQYSSNYYNTIEIWGGVNIGKKFQVLGFIPYYLNKQVDDDGTTRPHGPGDISVIGQYNIFSTTSLTHTNKLLQQQLWLGAGIKVATGSFNLDVSNPAATIADVNAELGTGSTDFIITGKYNMRVNNFGINAFANYKVNTINRQRYKYGNKFSTNVMAFYRCNLKHTSILPNVGIGYENVASNLLSNQKVEYTGNNVTNAIVGVEFTFREINLGLNTQLPVVQNFAAGQTQLKLKGMAHITLSL